MNNTIVREINPEDIIGTESVNDLPLGAGKVAIGETLVRFNNGSSDYSVVRIAAQGIIIVNDDLPTWHPGHSSLITTNTNYIRCKNVADVVVLNDDGSTNVGTAITLMFANGASRFFFITYR